jgi:hypothetical protein
MKILIILNKIGCFIVCDWLRLGLQEDMVTTNVVLSSLGLSIYLCNRPTLAGQPLLNRSAHRCAQIRFCCLLRTCNTFSGTSLISHTP